MVGTRKSEATFGHGMNSDKTLPGMGTDMRNGVHKKARRIEQSEIARGTIRTIREAAIKNN